jgi:hypothetical protein
VKAFVSATWFCLGESLAFSKLFLYSDVTQVLPKLRKKTEYFLPFVAFIVEVFFSLLSSLSKCLGSKTGLLYSVLF